MVTKLCRRCKKEKPLTEFRKDHRTKTGRGSECTLCDRKRQSKWAKANPDRVIAKNHKHRARKRSNGGAYTAIEWQTLKERYNYTCLCCGKREPDITLTIDHVLPISKGGSNNISNIQPLCGSCNSSKNAKFIDYRKIYERDR